MKIIDSHTHIFPPDIIAEREHLAKSEPWFAELYGSPKAKMATASQLLSSMTRAGVSHSVAFGFPFLDPSLREACNQYVLECAASSSGRIIPFAVISPENDCTTKETMETLASQGALGFGEIMPHGQRFSLSDSSVDCMIAKAQELRRPIMIHTNEPLGHTYPGKSGPGPTAAVQLSMRHPTASLIFSHWGGGLVYYETMPEVHAALKHTYYDSAALLYLYGDDAFHIGARLAQKRILFGTDYPLIEQQRFVQHVQQLGLDDSVLSDFFYNNAADLLGLTTESGAI